MSEFKGKWRPIRSVTPFISLAIVAQLTPATGLSAPTPEPPSIMRDVHQVEEYDAGGILNPQFSAHPVVPAKRTSADGRIAIDLRKNGGDFEIFLFKPEAVGAPVGLQASVGVDINAATPAFTFNGSTISSTVTTIDPQCSMGDPNYLNHLKHATLCDRTPAGGAANPRTCNPLNHGLTPGAVDPALTYECYDLGVILTFGDGSARRLKSLNITAVVEEPKTAAANLIHVQMHSLDCGPDLVPEGIQEILEPMVTRDGKLLVARTSNSTLDVEVGGTTVSRVIDMVYAYNDGGDACDVDEWHGFKPISQAHEDAPVRAAYGFAEYPIRDTEGTVIEAGRDLQGTYPWIDRDGANLFYTAIDATLYHGSGPGDPTVYERYPADCVSTAHCDPIPSPAAIANVEPSAIATRGVVFTGRWSHGKIVLVDNDLNNIDYGFGRTEGKQRLVTLYNDGAPVQVRLGSGRDNSLDAVPAGVSPNNTVIDSLENLFNHIPNLHPTTLRDVVWLVNSNTSSAEIAFDDFLDPYAFIVSNMAGSLVFDPGDKRMHYHDGWNQTSSKYAHNTGQEVRVQNAATAYEPETGIIIPSHGTVINGRLEPVALGGIMGRGLWLDHNSAVHYGIPEQGQKTMEGTGGEAIAGPPFILEDQDWYTGLFVDPRFENDGVWREVITFPNDSTIALKGLTKVGYFDAAGTLVHTINISAIGLTQGEWAHLGFAITEQGTHIEFLLNGFPFDTYSMAVPGGPYNAADRLFQMEELGTLSLGDAKPVVENFRGWIDDFKVLAYIPNYEVLCNHARGTLIGMHAGTAPTELFDYATDFTLPMYERLDAAVQGLIESAPSYDRYACFINYEAPHEVTLSTLPTGTESLRELFTHQGHFLQFGSPRPDFSAVEFCQSCHINAFQRPISLDPSALTGGTVNMEVDHRRQPLQPPALIFGHVPADHVLEPFTGGPPLPPVPLTAPATGGKLDAFVYP